MKILHKDMQSNFHGTSIYKGKYFGGNCLFISPSNLNIGLIPPWLENILNLAPLKCLEILPNCPDMWKLSD